MSSSLDTRDDLAATAHHVVRGTHCPQLASSSVWMLEHADWVRNTRWAVDWLESGASNVSSLTVPTAFTEPRASASTLLLSELSRRIAAVVPAGWLEELAAGAAGLIDSSYLTFGREVTQAVERCIPGDRVNWPSAGRMVIFADSQNIGDVISSPTPRGSVSGADRRGGIVTDRARTVSLLEAWLLEDAHSSEDSLESLKSGLDRSRESSRKLFS